MYVKAAASAATESVQKVNTQEAKSVNREKSTDSEKQTKKVQKDIVMQDAAVLELKREENQEQKSRERKQIISQTLPHSQPSYSVHEETNRIMIKIVDKNTKEVIKEIPPEKNLDLLAKGKQIAGKMLDETR